MTIPIPQTTPIYEHDAKSIIPHLIPHLPHAISLVRRIQHSLAYPSSTAKILATFPPTQQPPPLSTSPTSSPDKIPWLAARVDLFRGRETQIVVYSSLEKTCSSIDPVVPVTAAAAKRDDGEDHSIVNGNGNDTTILSAVDPTDCHQAVTVATFTAPSMQLEKAQTQFLALLSYIKINLLPAYLSSLDSAVLTEQASKTGPNDTHLIPPPPPQAFLLGSLHTGLYALLMRSGTYMSAHKPEKTESSPSANTDPLPGLKIHRVDYPPYYKYFFRRAVFASENEDFNDNVPEKAGPASLPHGYRYHDRQGRAGVQDVHLDLVQSRTHIPRSRSQLASMPGVAIYHDHDCDENDQNNDNGAETPIAWGFLGLDGALATLHVEPPHRGKGLALALSREVMRRGMESGVFRVGKAISDSDPVSDMGLGLDLDDELRERVGAWVHTEVAQYNPASRRVMEKIGGEVMATVVWMVAEVCG